MASKMKIDSPALEASHKTLRASAATAKNDTKTALKTVTKLGGTAGHKVFAAFVDGVLDELAAHLPDDIEHLIKSYADGLLDLGNAAREADAKLSHDASQSGVVAVFSSPGSLAAGGITLQGSGSRLQGSSISLQGSAPRAADGSLAASSANSGTGAGSSAAAGSPPPLPAKLSGSRYANPKDFNDWMAGEGHGRVIQAQDGDKSTADGQCTTWVYYRLHQLGLDANAPASGDGEDFAANMCLPPHQALAVGTGYSKISQGSVVSFPATSDGGAGHVAIVESVQRNGDQIVLTVSESNADGKHGSGALMVDSHLTWDGTSWQFTRNYGGSYGVPHPDTSRDTYASGALTFTTGL